jgi:hypothetical protein
MRKLGGLVVIAFCLSIVAVPAVATSTTTYVTYNCKAVKKEPAKIVFACADYGYYVDHLTWSSWSTTKAVGRGVFHMNDCKPNCASGHFHSRKGTLVLQKTMTCPKIHKTVFKHAEATYDKAWNGKKKQSSPLFCPI